MTGRGGSIGFVLLVALAAWGQNAGSFRVEGVIRGPREAISNGVQIHFEGETTQKDVITDQRGYYFTDLPFGVYTMTVSAPKWNGKSFTALRDYVRPPFRVTESKKITLNGTLYTYQAACNVVVLDAAGNPIKDEQQLGEARKNACGGQDMFPDTSQANSPFQVAIEYPQRFVTSEGFVYKSSAIAGVKGKTPVFVAYNLLSFEADEVAFNQKEASLEAKGNVVIEDGAKVMKLDAANFKINNGEVVSAALH